jgi:hypothetical protein
LLGRWDFRLEMRTPPIASLLARFVLTNERLIVLNLPSVPPAKRLIGRLGLTPGNAAFLAEMGTWHVMLNSNLNEIPEPVLGRIRFDGPTALPSDRALQVGPKNFPLGDDPAAETMAAQIHAQWVVARSAAGTPLR